MPSLARFPFFVLAPVTGFLACQAPDVPTPEDTAAYLGLVVGETIPFDSSGADAALEVKQSSVLRDGALVFDLVSKESGFVQDDRTFTMALDAESARIVRFADCIQTCGQPDADIAFAQIPLDTGASADTQVNVTVTRNGAEEAPVVESHTVLVGDEGEITVPAGTFTAFTVSWTRARNGDAQTSLLRIAPGTGIVSWQTFDGAELQRTSE